MSIDLQSFQGQAEAEAQSEPGGSEPSWLNVMLTRQESGLIIVGDRITDDCRNFPVPRHGRQCGNHYWREVIGQRGGQGRVPQPRVRLHCEVCDDDLGPRGLDL
jgi:hypothetical protein